MEIRQEARCVRFPFQTLKQIKPWQDDRNHGWCLHGTCPWISLVSCATRLTVPMTTHVGLCATSPDKLTLNFCYKSFQKRGGTEESFTERHISEKQMKRWDEGDDHTMTVEKKHEANEAESRRPQRRSQHQTSALRRMAKWIDAQCIHPEGNKTAGLQQ